MRTDWRLAALAAAFTRPCPLPSRSHLTGGHLVKPSKLPAPPYLLAYIARHRNKSLQLFYIYTLHPHSLARVVLDMTKTMRFSENQSTPPHVMTGPSWHLLLLHVHNTPDILLALLHVHTIIEALPDTVALVHLVEGRVDGRQLLAVRDDWAVSGST